MDYHPVTYPRDVRTAQPRSGRPAPSKPVPQALGHDDEDQVARLQHQLRQAVRFGDEHAAARLRSQICDLREDLQREFEQAFDGSRWTPADDLVAPNVTYTTPA